MMKRFRADEGSALALVLIFVTIFSLWLGATMFLASASAQDLQKALQDNANKSAASSGLVAALGQIANSGGDMGLSGSQNCDLNNDTVTLADGTQVKIECEAVSDSGAVQPLDAIILVGTSGTVGQGQGVAVNGPKGQPTAFEVTGSVRNLSGGWAGNSSIIVKKGEVRVLPGKSCGTVQLAEGSTCVTTDPKTDLRASNSQYWRAMNIKADKVANALARVQAKDLPNCSTDAGFSTGRMTLKPGFYDAAALKTLNNLTAGVDQGTDPTSPYYNSKNPARPNYTKKDTDFIALYGYVYDPTGYLCKKTPASSVTLAMAPGAYMMDFGGSGTWSLGSSLVRFNLIGDTNAGAGVPAGQGPASFGAPFVDNGCVYPATSLNRVDSVLAQNPNGVQMQFGGSASLSIAAGDVSICPTSYRARPQISIFAASSEDAGSVETDPGNGIYRKAWTGTGPLITTNGASYSLALYGTVFAPSAHMSLKQQNNGTLLFNSGAVLKALDLTLVQSKYPLDVKPPRVFNGDRVLRLTAKVNGKQVASVKVHIQDDFGLKPDRGYEVLGNS